MNGSSGKLLRIIHFPESYTSQLVGGGRRDRSNQPWTLIIYSVVREEGKKTSWFLCGFQDRLLCWTKSPAGWRFEVVLILSNYALAAWLCLVIFFLGGGRGRAVESEVFREESWRPFFAMGNMTLTLQRSQGQISYAFKKTTLWKGLIEKQRYISAHKIRISQSDFERNRNKEKEKIYN